MIEQKNDPSEALLNHFSEIRRDEYVIPLLKDYLLSKEAASIYGRLNEQEGVNILSNGTLKDYVEKIYLKNKKAQNSDKDELIEVASVFDSLSKTEQNDMLIKVGMMMTQ